MARTFILDGEKKLPKKLQNTIDSPSQVEGTRHAEMLRVVYQLVGERVSDSEIAAMMRKNYKNKSTIDIENAIKGAHVRNPSPTTGSETRLRVEKVNHTRFRIHAGSTEAQPKNELTGKAATLAFLDSVFRPEELVSICDAAIEIEGRMSPKHSGTHLTVEEWKKRISTGRSLGGESGVWVRVNPCKDDSGRDSGVSDYRHCLVEFDKRPTDEQWNIFKQSGLPIAAVMHSGGKSLHAWIKVDASSHEEFKERRDVVYSYLEEYTPDQANKNPSRWSRLPGVMRGENEQKLLALNIGAANWDEWERNIQDHELPEEIGIDVLDEFDRKNDPGALIGNHRWLCEGGSMIIQGQSGIGKSSLLMQMGISFALGEDFFGIPVKGPLRSVVLQAENDMGDMAEMFQDVSDGMGIDRAKRVELLRSQLRFFREQSRTGIEFVRVAERVIRKTKAQIIYADPLLAFVGGDISKQEIASQFLRNWLNPVLADTGVIWIWLHHVGKPRLGADKKGMSNKDLSYSGFGSSELVNWAREVATLGEDDEREGVYNFALSKRKDRAGLVDAIGRSVHSIQLQHASGRILWERAANKYSTPTSSGGECRSKRAREAMEKQ